MKTLLPLLCRELPDEFEPLINLALDLRLTWNQRHSRIWAALDPEKWEESQNPWWVLQNMSQDRIEHVIKYRVLSNIIREASDLWQDYINKPGWFKQYYSSGAMGTAAYFSMEFGLNEALPIYAGGLGILAGDFLKSASDLDVPLVGIGLLYQEGYFRQMLDATGVQIAAFPHNDLTNLPIKPAVDKSGRWLMVSLELPGRLLRLRVWLAQVGRIPLYLLDSNVQTNSPADRSIISKLYDSQIEFRLMQEMILGIAGWRVIKALDIPVNICHLNEGHAAFAALERARNYMTETGVTFAVALTATRAANIFTTHTPVASGFDSYPPDIIAGYLRDYLRSSGISMDEFLAAGRPNHDNADQPFNMAFWATRSSIEINGVSRLHGKVSRRIFQPLYPRWPEEEVPVSHITNGVHLPTWCSEQADELLNQVSEDYRLDTGDQVGEAIKEMSADVLWRIRRESKQRLVDYVQDILTHHLKQFVDDTIATEEARVTLKPDVLTIGFARRFTSYKRPNLILSDEERLARILTNPERPVQLIAAGKAHPHDSDGIRMIQQFINFTRQSAVRPHVVFLPDYDIAMSQQLIQGVDVWINTPRCPWEACGTSGMKVLINGGLNLSELDGWWAEAYLPNCGWHIGDGLEHLEPEWDAMEAAQLYEILEKTVVPEYYARDSRGLPLAWINRIRESMSKLAPRFSSNRMLRDYVKELYIPAALRLAERTASDGQLAKELNVWQESLNKHWHEIHFGPVQFTQRDFSWYCEIQIYLGEIQPDHIKVELYADPVDGHKYINLQLNRRYKIAGTDDGYIFNGDIASFRPRDHFAIRVIPYHPAAKIPLEENHILWKYPLENQPDEIRPQ